MKGRRCVVVLVFDGRREGLTFEKEKVRNKGEKEEFL